MSFGPSQSGLLLNYSATQQRAQILDSDDEENNDNFESEVEENSMPKKRRSKRLTNKKARTGVRRRRTGGGARRTKIRVTKGRVAVRVAGFSGIQHLGASQLITHIPLSKIRAAAKKVLNKSGKVAKRRRRKKGGRKKK
jgi:hypothetical protein